MMRGVTVIVGPARCGKTLRLVDDYRQVLATQPLGSALWLSPAHRSAAATSQQILDGTLGGCFSPNCLTFDQFARRVLEASGLKTRLVSPALEREILRRLVEQALRRGQLRYFAPIAVRSGFLDLLVSLIQELKRLEIWPQELAQAVGRRSSDKDRELCLLYDQYQRLLTAHDLYDPQGRFWSARNELRKCSAGPLARVRHVFVDGFTDFTRTEHEILDILADRVESLSISLPGELSATRGDLFAKSAKTLAELRRRHPQLVEDEMPRRPLTPAGLAHVERRLFADDRPSTLADDAEGIEVVAAGGAMHEIELLARRVKSLLALGDPEAAGIRVRPGDILIVFRSLDESAELVREVFAQFGIPVAIGNRPKLERAPILSALVAWLRLDLEDWPLRQVLALLMHNYFRPAWPQWRQGRAAEAAERWVRRLQIPAGRGELIGAIERFAESQSASPKTAAAAASARSAAALLIRMSESLDELPQRATPNAWAGAITRLAKSVGMLPCADADTPGDASDRAIWRQLVVALDESQRLSGWIDQMPAELSRREFFDFLRELLRCESLDIDADEIGRVRVLSAENARNLSAPYVFVAGMAEKAFPPANRESCLYGQAETAELAAAGLPLVPPADRGRFEMLLFYEVVTRATRRVVLSYPALDPKAQPLSPSPYLSAIEQLFVPGRIRKTLAPELSSVPDTDTVFSPRDFRVRAVSQALAGEAALLEELRSHALTSASADNVLAGLRTSWSRQRGESFGPFEGMLSSQAAERALAQRYGTDRCWSPSQLEQYARCPHQFFLERVLRLEPLEEPALESNYLGRGQMLHWLLSNLHRALNQRSGSCCSPADESQETIVAEIAELVARLLERLQNDRALGNALLEIDARRVAATLAGYWRQHAQYDARWRAWDAPLRPAHFEVSFGPRSQDDGESPGGPRDDDDPLSSGEPFELDCGGETVRFSGRIDRIDIGTLADQTVFNVVDYKSGRASKQTSAEAVLNGTSLQLPLYALAARKLLGQLHALPYQAAYWHLGGKGYTQVIQAGAGEQGAAAPDWGALESQLGQRVRSLIDGIRGGQFPMHSADDKCTSRCAYSTLCRVNQVRSLGKTWQAPGGPPS